MIGAFDKKVKSVYLDTSEIHEKKGAVLGAVFLFFCIYAGCCGVVFCVVQSFKFEVNAFWVMGEVLKYLLFFTAVYFLPSRLFILAALFLAGLPLALYIRLNLEETAAAIRAALNWCMYTINQAGYNIGALVDRELAAATPHEQYLWVFTLGIILITAMFSYFVYSRSNVIFTVILSIAAIFPGFFYGLIPGYFVFGLVAAFWVAHFTVNIFDAGYISRFLYKQSALPEKKLAKLKLKEFVREHKKNIKTIKTEIKTIAKTLNPEENILRLNRLLRQLETYQKPGFLFLKIYGLDKNRPKKSKTKPVNLIKAEKKRIKEELKNKKQAAKQKAAAKKKAFRELSFGERLKIKSKSVFTEKKRFFARSGFSAVTAFAAALAAVIIVQQFISPEARFDVSRPEQILSMFTSTVEHALVGSDTRVYGGYSGGMGGGYLYRAGGVRFRNRPILQFNLQNRPRINSGVIYLKGFTGSIYDGQRWIESDRNYIDEYNRFITASVFENSENRPESYFRNFTQYMQRAAGIDYRRRASELKADVITVEHLVTGGRRVFTPYFTNYITPHGYNIGKVADLQTEVTNSLFRRPQYTIDFYAVDNILDRQTGYAVEDIRGYLQRYIGILETFRFWTPERIMENFPGTAVMSGGELQDFIASFALTEGDFIDSLDLAENDFFDYYFTVPYFYREDAGYDVFMENRSRNNSDYHLVIPNEYYNGAHIFEDISRPAVFPNEYIAGEMAYYGFVREYYLQLPEELPPEILELTLEITRDLHTDYDKALAIEEYLAKNYEYTLSPSAPYDAGQDFVYNFLFDIKEGYCSYYATAMTVMMRLLGIPARESEGYLVDTRRITRDEDGNPAAIVVLDNNAHAWVEVYLRGIGWVPFEPTSSADEEEEPEEIRPYEYTPPARLPGTGEYMGTPEYEYDWDDDYEIPEQTDDVDLGRLYALIFGVVSAVLVIFAFYFINYGINKKRTNYFKTARPNAAALKMLVYLFNFLRLCGFNIRGDEGFTEFAGRVSRGFPMLRSEGWLNIMRIMQKARWSIHEISEEERNYACNFLTELREECLKNLKFGLKFKLRFVRFVI